MWRVIGESLLEIKEDKKALSLFNKHIKKSKNALGIYLAKAKFFLFFYGELEKRSKTSETNVDNRFFVSALWIGLPKIQVAQGSLRKPKQLSWSDRADRQKLLSFAKSS